MAIRIVSHSPAYTDAVLAFNKRMHDGGSPWGFYANPEPDWIPWRERAPTWREYYLAIDHDDHVRAGYALKPQRWLVRGQSEWVTDWQGPFTEGAIDPRYSTLGLRLIREMLKKYPLLFSAGHGGNEEPIVQLLRSLGWTLYPMPFCVRILRPYNFLRHNRYLRGSAWRRVASDFLAYTGIGAIGLHLLHNLLKVLKSRTTARAQAAEVPSFGDWTDELWALNQSKYACLAVRDSEMMNTLLPHEGWPGGIRLRIDRDGEAIGWAVVHVKQMSGEPRFGDLRVGLVTDCFGDPADAEAIIGATHEFLKARGVDIVCSNQSHPDWVQGFRGNGYVILQARRIFAISPQLKEKMEPLNDTLRGLHLTNLDGHGPHGYTS